MVVRMAYLYVALITFSSVLVAGDTHGLSLALVNQPAENRCSIHSFNTLLVKHGIESRTYNWGSFDYDFNDGITLFQQTLSDRRYAFGRVHKVLGYSTLLLAGVTALSNKNESLHCGAAHGTTTLAVATAVTGIISFGSRLSIRNGLFQRHNLHWILGSLGALCCTASVISADTDNLDSHSGLGIAGGVLMYVGFASIKF